MTIQSTVDLTTSLNTKIKANEIATFWETIFNTITLHSDKGSAIITTEYGKRYIESFGDLKITESEERDHDNMKIIYVDVNK